MIDESTHKATLKFIRDTLADILEDELGEFEVLNKSGQVLTTIPAITVEYPPLPNSYRMKADSGVEVVISRNPEMKLSGTLGGYEIVKDFIVELFQHDLTVSLTIPVEKIITCRKWEVVANPIIIDNIETPIGRVKPKAKIKLHIAYFQRT